MAHHLSTKYNDTFIFLTWLRLFKFWVDDQVLRGAWAWGTRLCPGPACSAKNKTGNPTCFEATDYHSKFNHNFVPKWKVDISFLRLKTNFVIKKNLVATNFNDIWTMSASSELIIIKDCNANSTNLNVWKPRWLILGSILKLEQGNFLIHVCENLYIGFIQCDLTNFFGSDEMVECLRR